MKAVLLATIAVCFITLSGFVDESGATPEVWEEFRNKLFSIGEKTETLEGIEIPRLVSATLANEWGPPEMRVAKNGSYELRYHNPDPDYPFEIVTILGFAAPMPGLNSIPGEGHDELVNGELTTVKHPQKWKFVTVLIDQKTGAKGKLKLRYFREHAGGGADGPRDSTDTFPITKNGKTGRYIIIVDTITSATKKRLKTLSVE